MLIRAGDTVEVIVGNSRGTRAKVVSVQPEVGKIIVEGVNRVYRHMKRSQKIPRAVACRKRCRSTFQIV